jgi:hypothetical protein
MPSCSSKVHYRQALVERRKAAKSKCRFFLTSTPPQAYHAVNFLKVALAGHDPTTDAGARQLLRVLNGEKHSGRVRRY